MLKRSVSQKLLFDALGSASKAGQPGQDQTVTFTIVRRDGGEPTEITATGIDILAAR